VDELSRSDGRACANRKPADVGSLGKGGRQDSIIPELTAIMKNYAKLLVAIQGMRFDLGIDEYRRGMSAAKKHFEDCEDQAAKQAIVCDAYATAEKILAKRFGSEANPAKRSN